MSYRDQAKVKSWVTDFANSHPGVSPQISVVDQYYAEGPDSGLVVVQLRTATTVTSIQPGVEDGAPTWRVHFDPREEGLDLDGEQTEALAADLTLLSLLCQYLQGRTDSEP